MLGIEISRADLMGIGTFAKAAGDTFAPLPDASAVEQNDGHSKNS
jgi:hypothetical protein